MQPWIDLVNETWRAQSEAREQVLRHFDNAGGAWQQPAVLQAQALLWERMWSALEANMQLWSAWWPTGLGAVAPTLCPPPARRSGAPTPVASAEAEAAGAPARAPAKRAPRSKTSPPARRRRA